MQLYAIETGHFRLDGGAMFGVVPKTLWEKLIPPDEKNRIPMAMRALLIDTGTRRILIDNGIGHKYDAKFANLYAIDHEKDTLEGSLRRVGLGLDEVTDVILTHLHFDHGGGSAKRVGDKILPTFPRATYWLQRRHWEWALNPNPREKASFFPENYLPLQEAGQLRLLDGETELFPSIFIRTFDGHTQAQQLVEIHYKDHIILYAADLFPTHAHVPLPYVMAYDVQPLITLQERQKILPWLVERQVILFYEHDTQVECSRVTSPAPGKYQAAEPLRLADL